MKTLISILALMFSVTVVAKDNKGAIEEVVNPGVLKIMDVSTTMINEIVTPYTDPQLIMPDEDQKYVSKNGSLLYVRMPDNKDFLQILIRDQSESGASLSLMLLPKKDLPGQHYVLKVEGSSQTGVAKGEDVSPYANNPYQSMMSELMRDAVRDRLKDGYNKNEDWIDGDFELGNLYATSEVQWIGANLVIDRYALVNVGKETYTVTEPNFYYEGVKAVTAHPHIMLAPGQKTNLYVIRNRKEGE